MESRTDVMNRKCFKTRTEFAHMKSLYVEILMGHDTLVKELRAAAMRFEVYSENPIVVRETTHLLTKLQYELEDFRRRNVERAPHLNELGKISAMLSSIRNEIEEFTSHFDDTAQVDFRVQHE